MLKKIAFLLMLLCLAGCHKKSSIAPSSTDTQTDDEYCKQNPQRCVPQVNPGVR